jgi:hypothetical protein
VRHQVPHPPVRPTIILSRLATYKLATFANKPPTIDAVAASKCGWINVGKDRLVCGICNVSWVVAGRDGMSRDAGKKVNWISSHGTHQFYSSECINRKTKGFIS